MKGPFMEYGHGDVGNGMSDPKPVDDNEFAEFMWMGEELDEFDQQVEQQLMEEFLIETCVEQMLRDEDSEESIPPDLHAALHAEMLRGPDGSTQGNKPVDANNLAGMMADLNVASTSRLNPNAPVFTLNPNASVFVPRGPPPSQPAAVAQPPAAVSSCHPSKRNEAAAPAETAGGSGSKANDEEKARDDELKPVVTSDTDGNTSNITTKEKGQGPSNSS